MNRSQRVRPIATAVAVIVLAGAGGYGARKVKAQAQPMRFGSVSAKASHGEADLNGKTVLLTGSVVIQTPDGQNIAADSVHISMGTNPVTKKDDVASATADGHVRFRTVQEIKPKGGAAYKRVITGTANEAVWQRFAGRADLTGDVTVLSDDPQRTMRWENAAKAIIDLKAGTVKADSAPGGPQMTFDMTSKQG